MGDPELPVPLDDCVVMPAESGMIEMA